MWDRGGRSQGLHAEHPHPTHLHPPTLPTLPPCQARSLGDAALVDSTSMELRRASMQRTIHDRLQGTAATARPAASASGTATAVGSGTGTGAGSSGDAAELERLVSELEQGPKDVSELYNDYAQPLKAS